MRRALATLLALGLACRAQPSGPPTAARAGVATSADELFSLGFVPELALTLDDASRKSLTDHPRRYVAATLAHGGRAYEVLVKLKGNRTFRHLDDKPSLRIKVAHDDFLGLHGLVLNSMVDDPSGMHELLAYRLFRAAGVPAPRAGYARLTIDGVPYGTYLMVEPVGRPLLAAALGAPPPAIFEGEYGCDVFAADASRIELKKGGDDARVAFTALGTAADDDPHALFAPGSPLDVPEVLSFLAIATLIGDFDGYWHSHNYYLALGADRRWRIVPWGEDRVLGQHLPIYGSQGRLAHLCFADHDCRLAYARRLRTLADELGQVVPAAVVRDDAALAAALLDDDIKSPYAAGDRRAARSDVHDFLHDRAATVREDLSCLDDASGELDRDGDGAGCMDCDDRDPAIRPGAAERCDQVDNDCDGLVDDNPACACETVEVHGARFQVCNLPMTWDDARGYCEAKGMSLARLDSGAEAEAVFARAVALRNDRWWLGSREADDGTFGWVDDFAFGYKNWGAGEPRNHRCDQRCVVLDEADHGHWALGDCKLYFPFVCRAP